MLSDNWMIHKLNTVGSTQSYVKENFLKSYKQIAVLAREQTAGYGQYNRQWTGTKDNLSVSLLFPNSNLSTQITLIVSIAVGQTIDSFKNGLKIQYKWVNDVLINQKKVAGILTEQIDKEAILGIGLNIHSHTDKTNILGATNLMENGLKVTAEEFLEKFLKIFTDVYNRWITNGFDFFRNAWKVRAYKLNKMVSVDNVKGIFYDIDNEDGSIVIKDANQQLIKIQRGSLI